MSSDETMARIEHLTYSLGSTRRAGEPAVLPALLAGAPLAGGGPRIVERIPMGDKVPGAGGVLWIGVIHVPQKATKRRLLDLSLPAGSRWGGVP